MTVFIDQLNTYCTFTAKYLFF